MRVFLLHSCWLAAFVLGATGTEQPLAGMVVALDVGHSKTSPGAISARGRAEFEFNLATAKVLDEILEKAGAKCLIINETGTLKGLAERPQRAQKLGAHVFISIHHDAVNKKYIKTWVPPGQTKTQQYSDKFKGYSVFCSKENWLAAKSRALALAVGEAMLEAEFTPTLHHAEKIPGENRPLINRKTGVYEFTDLVVAKAGRIPSILLECGVIVHRKEELEVKKRTYQERIGKALVAALTKLRKDGVLPR